VTHTTHSSTGLAAASAQAGAAASRWTRIGKRAVREFLDDRVPMIAAGVTFYALLAFFPAVAAFISLYGLFADVHAAREHLHYLRGFLPPGTLRYVGDEMIRVTTTHDDTKLGTAFFVGLLISLWSANTGIKSLLGALNTAYEQKERRGFLRLYATSFALTIGALLLFIAGFAAIVAIPVVELRLGPNELDVLASLRWPFLLFGTIAAIAVIYRYGTSHVCRGKCRTLPGAAFAGTAWVALSVLFSWYVTDFAHYDRTYGSLGGVIGLMTWIWLGVIVILLGAELNSELERP
jgi:membrane protein